MSTEAIISGVVFALLFYYFFLRRLWIPRLQLNDEVYEALRSPSVRNARTAFDRRVALAVRDAEQGIRPCHGCGFTNPERSASCLLCGASLARPTPSFFKWGRHLPRDEIGSALTVETSRQRRIRKRGEWKKIKNEDETVVWRHEQQACQSTTSSFLVYVMTALKRDPEPEIVVDSSDKLEDSSLSLHEVSRRIENDLQSVEFIFKPTVDGDAVVTEDAFPSDNSLGDSITCSQLDFPTKLAHFVTTTASLFDRSNADGAVEQTTRLDINRPNLLADSIEAVATIAPSFIRSPIRVDFIAEQGIDAGGVYREWLQQLDAQLISPEAGIFACVDHHEHVHYLNPHSKHVVGEGHLAHVYAAGRLLGRSLLEGNVAGFHLALPLLKIILGIPVGFVDIEFFDPEIFASLTWLLENDGADALGLDFTTAEKLPDGSVRVVELVDQGSDIDVTDVNKLEYVECKVRYLLFTSVHDQLFAFLRGLYEVIPKSLLAGFDPEELDFVLSGSDAIDVDDWESHTVTSMAHKNGRLDLLPAYKNFWIVVRELSVADRRRLLQFATGSTRVPPGGFSSLTSYDGRLCLFELRGVPIKTTHGFLHSHACFNRLDLPTYWDLKSMRAAIHAAIMCDEIGFTTD